VGSRGAENISAMRVFDSNILIYHLNDALPPSVLTQVESWITEGAVISVMSRIEVLGYPQTADQLQQAMRLLAYFDEIPLHFTSPWCSRRSRCGNSTASVCQTR
jgi:hypothetical protein